MQALLEHFITQSTVYSLMAVLLVAFLESLALVGLILPGTVLMAGLGALIGSGELSFWHAWLAGIVGCLLGDWISFWLGWRFKKPLHRWSFLKKNKALLDKTEHALHQHSMFSLFISCFLPVQTDFRITFSVSNSCHCKIHTYFRAFSLEVSS